jgi:putative ABC transport system permease protein
MGILFTYPAADAFARAVGEFFPVFNIAKETIYLDIAASVIIGVVAAVFPIWRAVSVPIASGLGRIG